MTLDLNQLHVESFHTDPGSPELLRGSPTNEVILCAEQGGSPTNEVILCAEQGGSATNQAILCAAGVPLPTCTLTTR